MVLNKWPAPQFLIIKNMAELQTIIFIRIMMYQQDILAA